MDLDPVILSRIQFAFVISFHIIFPAFTIGLAAWLATIEGARLATGDVLYRRVFDFWIKDLRAVVRHGRRRPALSWRSSSAPIWGVLAEKTGPIQGPLLGYEAFTAFMLEATFFGETRFLPSSITPKKSPRHECGERFVASRLFLGARLFSKHTPIGAGMERHDAVTTPMPNDSAQDLDPEMNTRR